jgi:hypothetical protein
MGRKAWLLALLPLLLAAAAGGGWAWRRHRRRAVPPPQVVPQPILQAPAPPPVEPAPQAQEPVPAQSPSPQESPKPNAPETAARPAPKEVPPAKEPNAKATVRDAAQNLEEDPKTALASLNKVLEADPNNERALALRIVALYDLQNYLGCAKAMVEARTSGHPLWPMALKYPRLRKMLERERDNPHLPRKRAVQPQQP